MKISIITVAFNSAATIADTIHSVAAQSHPDLEHIVIDGASTDDTVAIVRKAAGRVSTLISEPDEGIYDAMNKGIAHASGDIIGFLNSDDFYADPDALKWVEAAMENGSDSCYGDLCYVAQKNISTVIRYWKSSKFSPRLFEKGWCPPHPTFFVKHSIYKKLGGFNPEFGVAADVELMARFLEKEAISSQYIPKTLVNMRMGGASNRSFLGILKQNIEVRRALISIGLDFSLVKFTGNKIISRANQFLARPQTLEQKKRKSHPTP